MPCLTRPVLRVITPVPAACPQPQPVERSRRARLPAVRNNADATVWEAGKRVHEHGSRAGDAEHQGTGRGTRDRRRAACGTRSGAQAANMWWRGCAGCRPGVKRRSVVCSRLGRHTTFVGSKRAPRPDLGKLWAAIEVNPRNRQAYRMERGGRASGYAPR
jgi:hypothetical protein